MLTVFERSDHCPACLKLVDAATSMAKDAQPKKGDLTICVYCGTLLQFGEFMRLSALSDEELRQLDEETQRELLHAQKVLRLLKKAGQG
jgi:hypothetical protein